MKIGGYEVEIEQSEDGSWWAFFPDGPCVCSVGDTPEEAIREQRAGLEFLLDFEAEEREKAAQAKEVTAR